MPFPRRSTPHLRLTAAIIIAMLAALAGGIAADSAESRTRRSDLHSALRLVVVADDASRNGHAEQAHGLARAVEVHGAAAALLASDSSSVRAERTLRRLAAHARTALLKTTALPPPVA
jgi:hypothetical protein